MITIVTTIVLMISMQYTTSYAKNTEDLEYALPEIGYQANEDSRESPVLLQGESKFDPKLQELSDLLIAVLEEPWRPGGLPLLYVEDISDPGSDVLPRKRSRYYRRYPWKRQNSRSRSRYEPDNRYMCQPTRDDVFKLLVALHETRSGNGGRSIHFCNRRKSPGSIFTNIRFLGRR